MPNGYLGLGGICVESLQIIEDEGLGSQLWRDASTAVRMKEESCLISLLLVSILFILYTPNTTERLPNLITLTPRLPQDQSRHNADRRRYPPSHYFG